MIKLRVTALEWGIGRSSPVEQTDIGANRVFIVHFSEQSDSAAKRLRARFSHVYELVPTLYLIRSSQLASEIAVAVGIKGEDRLVNGVVFLMNHIYSGYHAKDLWDWLQTE